MAKSEIKCAALGRVKELLGGETFPKCESASLRLEKFVRIGGDAKKEEIDAVVSKTPQKVPPFAPKGAICFSAKLGGRLIVDQAGGVLENAGLCLHPHFNAPCIPGSAVKGVARHAAWEAWNAETDAARKNELAEEIAQIFGYPTNDDKLDEHLESLGWKDARSGSVCFMPAYPETTAKLVTDIVNCHHPKYYAGDEKYSDAADIESPIPNFFPAVESGAAFRFAVVPVRGNAELAEKAKHWLVVALTENGAGAKTSAGYGWFDYDEAAEALAQQRREEAAKAAAEAKAVAEAKAKAEMRDSMTLLQKWQEQNKKAICNGAQLKGFVQLAEATKIEIVRILQMPDGIGHEVWDALNRDKKLRNLPVADAIRKFCKEHKDANGNKDMGKMPQ